MLDSFLRRLRADGHRDFFIKRICFAVRGETLAFPDDVYVPGEILSLDVQAK